MHQRLLPLLISLLAVSAFTAQPQAGTLDEIKKSGVFRIGYRANTLPFSFVDESGGPAGYSVALCLRIGAAVKEHLKLANLEIKYFPVDMNNRFSAVANGEVDILCSATTITLSRQEQVDFTLMTFLTGGCLLSSTSMASKCRESGSRIS